MHRAPTSGISLAALCLAVLLGCLREETPAGPSAESASPLRSCLGEPAYSPGAMQTIYEALAADPKAFCDDPLGGVAVTVANPVVAEQLLAPMDTLRLRTHVLDAQCRYVGVFETSARVHPGSRGQATLWDGRAGDGTLLPTGEYYLNTEVIAWDGSRDTVSAKVGLVTRAHCQP